MKWPSWKSDDERFPKTDAEWRKGLSDYQRGKTTGSMLPWKEFATKELFEAIDVSQVLLDLRDSRQLFENFRESNNMDTYVNGVIETIKKFKGEKETGEPMAIAMTVLACIGLGWKMAELAMERQTDATASKN